MSQTTANLLYIIPMAEFILALHFLSSPRHARLGNQIGAAGMVVAILVTLFREDVTTGWWIMALGGAIGAVIGVVGARKVKMTAMPQMVALFNGVCRSVGTFEITSTPRKAARISTVSSIRKLVFMQARPFSSRRRPS